MEKYCMLNGALIPEAEAHVSISDLSVRRGYGIFDYFRVRGGIPMYLDRHLDRFMTGAEASRMDHGFRKQELADQVRALIHSHPEQYDEGAVRIVLTGGSSPWEPETPTLMMTYEPMKNYEESVFLYGAKVITHPFLRELAHLKTISYMNAIFLAPELREKQAIEVLYHHQGNVSEFSRSNIFAFREGTLITPGEGMLNGITRGLVLEIARQELPVLEVPLKLETVLAADEVFMTSTIKRIIPIVKIDQTIIGNGKPGGVTRSLMAALSRRDIEETTFDLNDQI